MSLENWKNKKVAFLGDSITFGSGLTSDRYAYRNILSRECGIIPYSYAVSGAKFDDLLNQAKVMLAETEGDVDAVFIFAGTNDYYAAVPMGEWYKTEEIETHNIPGVNEDPRSEGKRFKRTPVIGENTFKGNINALLDFVKRNFLCSQVILLTPIHRGFATFAIENYQFEEYISNGAGLFLDDYVSAVKEAANIWSTELIDLNAVSGLIPAIDGYSDFFCSKKTDLLHPGVSGHRRIADVLEAKMPSIPLFRKTTK